MKYRKDWFLERPIAHRGLHNIYDGVAEHSRLSIERAIEAELPVEIDLVCSIDQRNFVIHDFVLDNLTDKTGDIRRLSSDVVVQARLCGMKDEPVMLFEQLLELVNGRVPIMVEIKSRDPVINQSVVSACKQLKCYDGLFSVQSFNPYILDWVHQHYPHFCIGLLTYDTDYLEHRGKYLVSLLNRNWKPDFIGQQMNATNSWTFQWVLETGLPIIAFTVRDEASWNESMKYSSNIFFEYVEPDRSDWRRRAALPWRSNVGERVDRRNCLNPVRASRLPDENIPWFNRTRISKIDYE